MKPALKLKIALIGAIQDFLSIQQKPSANLPNLVRLSLFKGIASRDKNEDGLNFQYVHKFREIGMISL
jgi:hypothetical protein